MHNVQNALEDFGVTRLETKLNNGVRVVLFQRPAAPISTYAILNSGSQFDPETMPGAAHFIEHMITNGSGQFPTKDLLAEHIESVGGGYGAFTNKDLLVVWSEVSEKSDYSRVADVFRSTLCESLFDKSVFENEKHVVVKEIHRSDSRPDDVHYDSIVGFFTRGTTYEHAVLGDERTILNLEYDSVLSHYKKLFEPARLTFVAAGDISLDELVSHLDTLPLSASTPFRKDQKYKLDIPKDIIDTTFFDSPETQIYLGVKAPEQFSLEAAQMNILGSILAGGRSSRLTKRLRYQHGLVYGVSASRFGGQSLGTWGVDTATSENKVQHVIDEIVLEIKAIQADGITENELQFIKDRRVKSLKRHMQTSDEWVNFHGRPYVLSPRHYDVSTYIQDVQDTTIQDIQRLIETYLQPENWRLVLCGRTKPEDVTLTI